MPIYGVKLLSAANIVAVEDDDQGPSDVRDAVEEFLAYPHAEGECLEITVVDPDGGVVDHGDGTFTVQGDGGDPRDELVGIIREFLALDLFAALLASYRDRVDDPAFVPGPLHELARRAALAARVHGKVADDDEEDTDDDDDA